MYVVPMSSHLPTGLRSQPAKSRNPMTKVSELASNQITVDCETQCRPIRMVPR
jgi:hypothetical protein